MALREHGDSNFGRARNEYAGGAHWPSSVRRYDYVDRESGSKKWEKNVKLTMCILPYQISERYIISIGTPLEVPSAFGDLVALPCVCREEMALLWKHRQVSVPMHIIHVGPPQLAIYLPAVSERSEPLKTVRG